MLQKLISLMPSKKTRDVASMASGMLLLLGGQKWVGLATFAKGAHGLEMHWRDVNDFDGDFRARWEQAIAFYDETHQHPINRKLHLVGIPIIVGGTAGLLAFRPYRPLWALSAGAFTFGWVLNFIGHGVFEKNAPAFADDPLSFLAGPIWDLTQLRRDTSSEAPAEEDSVRLNVDPQNPALA